MKNKKIILAALIILTIFGTAGLVLGANSILNNVQNDTIKIGVLLPLTGPSEVTGKKLKYAIEVAEEIINGEHPEIKLEDTPYIGLPNLDNKKIEFIYSNHRASPEVARTEAERLIKEEKVIALIGAYHSSATKTASQVAEELKVPFLSGSSSAASLTNRGYEYFSRIAPNDDMETEFFFEYLKYLKECLNIDIKSVGEVCIDNEYGVHASEMINKWLENKYNGEGFIKVVEIRYSQDMNDIDESIKKIKEVEPDVIFQASYLEDVTQFVKKYKEYNIVPKAVVNYCGGFHDPQFVENLGDDGNYFSGSSASLPSVSVNNDAANQINEIYKKKTGEDIDGPALEEFASAMIIADAINTSGEIRGDAIMEVLRTKTFETPYFTSNQIKFDESGQNLNTISFMVQIQDGKYEAVWPLNIQNKIPQILSQKWGLE